MELTPGWSPPCGSAYVHGADDRVKMQQLLLLAGIPSQVSSAVRCGLQAAPSRMGAASSITSSAVAPHSTGSPQYSTEDRVKCSQTLVSSGSADPILAVYIYADSRDTIAHSAAVEFLRQHMPGLSDMAASRGLCMLSLPVESEEQILDTYNAVGIFSERCSHTLLIFTSDTSDSGLGLPAQLPLSFVRRCVAALTKKQPEAAHFLSHTLNFSPRPSFTSCFADGWSARAYVHVTEIYFLFSSQNLFVQTMSSQCRRTLGSQIVCRCACVILCSKHAPKCVRPSRT
jgi:hypothetical protein